MCSIAARTSWPNVSSPPLSPHHQVELSAALDRADRLLRAATTTLDVVDPSAEPAMWAMSQYFDELDHGGVTGCDLGGLV